MLAILLLVGFKQASEIANLIVVSRGGGQAWERVGYVQAPSASALAADFNGGKGPHFSDSETRLDEFEKGKWKGRFVAKVEKLLRHQHSEFSSEWLPVAEALDGETIGSESAFDYGLREGDMTIDVAAALRTGLLTPLTAFAYPPRPPTSSGLMLHAPYNQMVFLVAIGGLLLQLVMHNQLLVGEVAPTLNAAAGVPLGYTALVVLLLVIAGGPIATFSWFVVRWKAERKAELKRSAASEGRDVRREILLLNQQQPWPRRDAMFLGALVTAGYFLVAPLSVKLFDPPKPFSYLLVATELAKTALTSLPQRLDRNFPEEAGYRPRAATAPSPNPSTQSPAP